MVKNMITDHRGVEVWRRLKQRYKMRGKAQHTAIEEEILGTKWPTDADGIPSFFDDLEALEEEYNKICKDDDPSSN